MSSGLIIVGLGLAAGGLAGRAFLRNKQLIKKAVESLPVNERLFSKYHFGGFEAKMTKREASLILGVPHGAKPERVKQAYKRVMIANHPDRGGSPYLAAKINFAKDMLEKNR
ncbi:mitochondrial import inner membrane translocase subunit TIM14 [Ditylenchus destructor]|uniref:DnaJ homolog subfamily C member 21 n=1 Tax=Ditylenchus destructor TaxID=166010 RepID=A0AAD4NFD7_9BILA|nr:mitochondrial import inner membrane translocase subunit TIM14 [Ditylenchus destructor]